MPPPERPDRHAYRALAFLSALAFLNYMDRSLVFPLLAPIAREVGLAPGSLGTLATAFDVVYACSAPLVGMASDRLARKNVLLVLLVGWTLTTGLTGLATGYVTLLLFRSATGLAEGGYFPTANSMLGDAFPARVRSRAIAVHAVSATLGGSAGYAFGGLIGERWGWRAPFLLSLLPGVALAVAFARSDVGRGRAAPERPRVHERVSSRPALRTVSAPVVLLMSLAACLAAFTMSGMMTFLPLYLTESYRVPVGRAGILTGVVFATTIVGQLSGGVLSDRIAHRFPGGRPACVAAFYVAMAPAVFAMAGASTVAGVLACYAASQLFRGLAEPSVFGTILDGTRSDERGTAQGFLIALTFGGASAAGAGVGAIIAGHGFPAALRMLAVVSVAAAGFAGTLALLQRRAGDDGRAAISYG